MSKIKNRISSQFTTSNNHLIQFEEMENEIKVIGLENKNLNVDDANNVIKSLQKFINFHRKNELKQIIKNKETNIRLCKQNLVFFIQSDSYQSIQETRESISKQEKDLKMIENEYNSL